MTCQWHSNPGLVESCTSSVWLRFHKPIRVINSLPSNIMMLTAALDWREGSSLGWFIHIEHDDLHPQPTVVRTYWFGCDDTVIQHRLLIVTYLSLGLGCGNRSLLHWFWPVYVRVLWHVTAAKSVPAGLWTQASCRVWSLNRALVLLLF